MGGSSINEANGNAERGEELEVEGGGIEDEGEDMEEDELNDALNNMDIELNKE